MESSKIMREFVKSVVRWLATTKILILPRRIMGRIIRYAILSNNGVIVYYNEPDKAKVFNLIRQIKKETEMLLHDNEAYQVFMAVERTEKIKGDIAEVGVYKGGSAKLICEAKGDRLLHLFDTFEGLPEVGEIDTIFHKGQFNASFEYVKDYLKKYPNVYFYKGLFPATAEPVKNKSFSFVNLDTDIYKSTLDCLKFFYCRMSKGGIILSHDYFYAAGVKKHLMNFLGINQNQL